MEKDLEKDDFNAEILSLEQEFMRNEWSYLDDLLDATEYYFDKKASITGEIEGKSV